METKRDISDQAKTLLASAPEEAFVLYRRLWEEFQEEYNAWDALFTLKAMRAMQDPDISLATQLAEKFIADEKVTGIYGWLIFDRFIKQRTSLEIKNHEGTLTTMLSITPQKDTKEKDAFPCPVTISVFKLVDAYKENLFNAHKINEWLDKLDYALLSNRPQKITTEERGDIMLASDAEKYFSFKTKALIKLKAYEVCRALCEQALENLVQFHYNNDLWFHMRIALCEEKLGNLEKSERLFQELLTTKAGSDKWFLYKDIAEVYMEQQNFEKAWKYAVDGAYYGNEPQYLIGLYHLQAQILFRLDRVEDGKILAQLIAAILKEQNWNLKGEYKRLFEYFQIDPKSVGESKIYLKEARLFWVSERYKDLVPLNGTIIQIHRNGKIGRIRDTKKGLVYNFRRNDFVRRQKDLLQLQGADVQFFPMKSFDDKHTAEQIEVIKIPPKLKITNLVGKQIKGKVKDVAAFGIFIAFDGLPDGLLHKSNLPRSLQHSFQNDFSKGDFIEVEVINETPKGLQLKFKHDK